MTNFSPESKPRSPFRFLFVNLSLLKVLIVKNQRNKNSFQIMLIVMLAFYSLFFNVLQQTGAMPFLDMHLYTKKSPHKTHYSLRFTELNNQKLDSPLYLDTPNEWLSDNERYEALDLVNQLGVALYEGDQEQAAQLHQQLVDIYFSQLNTASYDLVLRVVNPVEKYSMDNEPMIDQLIQRYNYKRILTVH